MISRKQLAKDYKRLFISPGAANVIKDLEAFCCEHRTTYTGDVHEALINEGSRRVLKHIQFYLNADTEKLSEQETNVRT